MMMILPVCTGTSLADRAALHSFSLNHHQCHLCLYHISKHRNVSLFKTCSSWHCKDEEHSSPRPALENSKFWINDLKKIKISSTSKDEEEEENVEKEYEEQINLMMPLGTMTMTVMMMRMMMITDNEMLSPPWKAFPLPGNPADFADASSFTRRAWTSKKSPLLL